jgi:hypothetical protein
MMSCTSLFWTPKPFLWNSYCLACCTDNSFRTNRRAILTSLRKFITHTFCFFKLCNKPADSDSRWRNNSTNRKFSTILYFSSALPTATNKCPKRVEGSEIWVHMQILKCQIKKKHPLCKYLLIRESKETQT